MTTIRSSKIHAISGTLDGCLNVITLTDSIRISTYSHPGEYPNDVSCTWTANCGVGNTIVLNFLSFELEGASVGYCR